LRRRLKVVLKSGGRATSGDRYQIKESGVPWRKDISSPRGEVNEREGRGHGRGENQPPGLQVRAVGSIAAGKPAILTVGLLIIEGKGRPNQE